MKICISDCKGWVTLLSPWNKGKIEISSRKLQRRMRKLGKTNIRKKIKARGMRFARVNGNCCWELREYYHGGETKHLERAHTYHLPWSIRSVKLVECWFSNKRIWRIIIIQWQNEINDNVTSDEYNMNDS